MIAVVRAASVAAFAGMAVMSGTAAGQTIQAGDVQRDSSACLANIPGSLMKRAGIKLESPKRP